MPYCTFVLLVTWQQGWGNQRAGDMRWEVPYNSSPSVYNQTAAAVGRVGGAIVVNVNLTFPEISSVGTESAVSFLFGFSHNKPAVYLFTLLLVHVGFCSHVAQSSCFKTSVFVSK